MVEGQRYCQISNIADRVEFITMSQVWMLLPQQVWPRMSIPSSIRPTIKRTKLYQDCTGRLRVVYHGKQGAKSYSCYNAFSHLDMRVEVKIPGGVESYCIDERGDKRVASEGLWLETFLCAVLRAYSYADDGSGDGIKKIIGVRRFDPITSTEVEHKFLDAAERLFFKGMLRDDRNACGC